MKLYKSIAIISIGVLCTCAELLLNPGKYGTLSVLGIMLMSLGIVDLFLRLLNKGTDPEILLPKFLGASTFFAGVLGILLDLLYCYIFKGLMTEIIYFSFAVIPVGLAMIISNPNHFTDEELKELVSSYPKNIWPTFLNQTTLMQKISWVVCFVGGFLLAIACVDNYKDLLFQVLS